MKKTIIAAVAALFLGINANAQSVNDNQTATVADVVAELNQADALQFIPMYQKMLTEIETVCRTDNSDDQKTAKIEDIKEVYTDMFSQILVSEQNEIAMNSVSMEYFNNRIAK
jgi:cellobiose phosphorylase